MSWFYRRVLRPALFAQDAERVHERTLRFLSVCSRTRPALGLLQAFYRTPELPSTVFGLRFPNPVGLAAGMDKFAQAVPAWAALGLGFTELGAATFHAQPGNPLPRVFRAIPEEAIVNRMGFNNPGAEALAQALATWRKSGRWPAHPVGMNLGKSKITPLDEAAADYAASARLLREHLDFFVVNVSSPNTPNLRQLQDRAALAEIIDAVQEALNGKPVLVKVAPDLTLQALDEVIALALEKRIMGVIATNTTITRPQSNDASVQKVYTETGGLSGKPLRQRSTEIIRHIHTRTKGSLPIIGVGGIFTAADAWEKINAGASLVQVYTGLVFEGPGIAQSIVSGLRRRMEKLGLKSLHEAVGQHFCAQSINLELRKHSA